MRLGVISDIHLRLNSPDATEPLRRALEHFRSIGVDGVVVAGDLTDLGTRGQLELFARTWNESFPGCSVARLFVTGNHDVHGAHEGLLKENGLSREEWAKDAMGLADRRFEYWPRVSGEPYRPFSIRTVAGHRFVLANYGESGLAGFLEDHRAELEGDRPFFYVAHLHPRRTCGGEYLDGMTDAESAVALSRFPNAVALTGHSHTTLTDDRMCWKDGYISIGTGTLFWNIPWGGRENASHFGEPDPRTSQMPVVSGKAWQGLVIDVWDDRLVVERREFRFGERLGPDWVVPFGNDLSLSRPYPCMASNLPRFAPDASFAVREFCGRNRRGEEVDQVAVTFPTSKSRSGHPRAFDYLVEAEVEQGDGTVRKISKRVYSSGWNLGESHDARAEAVFSRMELSGAGDPVFTVFPLDCLGRRGPGLSRKRVITEYVAVFDARSVGSPVQASGCRGAGGGQQEKGKQ